MERRHYRLGKRRASADRTAAAIVTAARDLVAASGEGQELTVGAVAERAGVSRLTVYNRFGSKAGLLTAIALAARGGQTAEPGAGGEDSRELLRRRIAEACGRWASDPALFRRLPAAAARDAGSEHADRVLAERLAGADELRAGCSLKEAEDVIGVLTSFPAFDRLHMDGRRSTRAVAEILMRLAEAVLVHRDT
jgi:AcrR family transcriptional regulator